MGKKLYVGNLAYAVTDGDLLRMFEPHGTVQSAQVIMDRDAGRSKGFGFVEMGADQEAQNAITALNGQQMGGRALTVNEARPKTEGSRSRVRQWRRPRPLLIRTISRRPRPPLAAGGRRALVASAAGAHRPDPGRGARDRLIGSWSSGGGDDQARRPIKPPWGAAMPATKQPEQRDNLERSRRDAFDSLIKEQIIHTLGVPRDLLQVQVRPLWEGYYRANVFIGKDGGSAQVADSFFLRIDGDGNIIASTPAITKKY